jgi:hypothetical protein
LGCHHLVQVGDGFFLVGEAHFEDVDAGSGM